ncbi:MAG TPA: AbrB/MazE/SpoVT family DNA-binding domain-containing protein [Syntrophorhabdaceae bacterium]|nr:AbrB/MazE/SpoVT family DNA-binding domain-containing protein [Syntrophorhabdaceae bacterium]
MPLAKVLRNGQITFPKEIRDSLNLKAGDIVDLEVRENMVIVRPKTFIDSDKVDLWEMMSSLHERLKDRSKKDIKKTFEKVIAEVEKQPEKKA